MSRKDDIHRIVCVEPGLGLSDICDRAIRQHKVYSRVARWFGPDSFWCDVLAPSEHAVLVHLRALVDAGRVRAEAARHDRPERYFPMEAASWLI